MHAKGLIKRCIHLLTFTDIPIRNKLFLFAAGGIAWFVIIALIGLGAVMYVNGSSRSLTDQVVPQIKASQKLIIHIRGANVSVHNIVIHDEPDVVNRNYQRAGFLLGNIESTLMSLQQGGKVEDYSDLTGDLIEEFQVEPITGHISAARYMNSVVEKNNKLRNLLKELRDLKLEGISHGGQTPEERDLFMSKLDEYDSLTVQAVVALGKLTSDISALQKHYTGNIKSVLRQSMVVFVCIGSLAILLVIIFSSLLRHSITSPLKAITDQMKGLTEGEVDLTKQIVIGSNDEIAELSESFNLLMNTIHDMNTFKKVIEEDDTLVDVYIRMAEVFYEQLGLDDPMIFEISNRNAMKIIETPYSKNELCCNKGILVDSTLCRARKTGHTISSISHEKICKQYLMTPEKYHVCLPVIVGGTTGGVIQFQFDKTLKKDNEKQTPIMDKACIQRQILKAEQYIRESSSVIETKRLTSALRESSIRDQMTGLYNRRFLEEYMNTLLAGVARNEGQLGLLMCDLDYFKQVNDKHGHDAGDAVLKETAHVIVKSARGADLVIRFGGEEFLVIVNKAKPGDADAVAERIRKNIEMTKVKTAGGIIQKTISIGYCEFPKDTQNFWEAIKFADIAMYKAKEAGRNRVLQFNSDMWTANAY